jgi:hypothetical protein
MPNHAELCRTPGVSRDYPIVRMSLLGLLACLLLAAVGCGGIKRDTLVLLPDSPMLVNAADKTGVLVSVYDPETNSMVEYGWLTLDSLSGWTLTRYDWTNYIEDHE